MKRVFLATAVSAAFALAAPALFAQSSQSAENTDVVAQAAPAPAPSEQRGGPHHGPGAHGMHMRMPSERIEARLAYIRTALKITDAQQAQWDTFANVMRKHASDMDQRMKQRMAQHQAGAQRPERPQLSAVERLERQQQRLAQRSARLNEVITAAKPLYASFSPEQKQIADQMLAQGEHRRGPRGGGHHSGMHRGT